MTDCFELRNKFNIPNNMIGNFDEINLAFNVVRGKTLAKRRSNFVFVKTHGQ